MARFKSRKLTGIQKWIDSRQGQIFLNFAYSWGAAVVILGALFKLTHISGANLMLFVGMGTEVLVFFISGFECPWDKEDDERYAAEAETADETVEAAAEGAVVVGGSPVNGPIIIGGGVVGGVIGGGVVSGATEAGEGCQFAGSVDAAQLAGQIGGATVVSAPQFSGMTPEMEEATKAYVEQLNELTSTLKLVAEQSARLTRDSEEMETMNRTLTGINRFYEMQLRSVGNQSSTVDEVHEQTKRLAEQLDELNNVYARMVEALKVNVK